MASNREQRTNNELFSGRKALGKPAKHCHPNEFVLLRLCHCRDPFETGADQVDILRCKSPQTNPDLIESELVQCVRIPLRVTIENKE